MSIRWRWYKIPCFAFQARGWYTNTAGLGAYRGPWAMESLARETLLDRAARKLGIDPIEIRRRNLVTKADQPRTTAFGIELTDITPAECMEALLLKQLIELGAEPLVRRVAKLAAAEGGHEVSVVVGCEAERVKAALQGVTCTCLENPAWSVGIASSIRTAVGWAEAREHSALMLLVCDQTRLTPPVIQQLWAAWAVRPQLPAASAYADTLGIPAIFPRAYFASLLKLEGDRGAAKLLRGADVSVVAWPDGSHDVDTPADLEQLAEEPAHRGRVDLE